MESVTSLDLITPRNGDFSAITVANDFYRVMGRPDVLDQSNGEFQHEKLTVTPRMAETIMDFPKRFQRTIKSRDVTRYAKAMAAKQFDNDSPIIIGIIGKKGRSPEELENCEAALLDGQHRFMAVNRAKTAVHFHVKFRVFNTEEDMRNYALPLDSGAKRTAHDRGAIAELPKLLGINAHEAAAHEKSVRAIMRMGLDDKTGFTKEDQQAPLRVFEACKHYGPAVQRLTNMINFGVVNTNAFSKELNVSRLRKTAFRELTLFAPMLLWTSRSPGTVLKLLQPIVNEDRLNMTPVHNTFLELCDSGFDVKEATYRAVTGRIPTASFRLAGDKSQYHNMMATFLCLQLVNQKRKKGVYNMRKLSEDVLRRVDLAPSKAEIDWPMPYAD